VAVRCYERSQPERESAVPQFVRRGEGRGRAGGSITWARVEIPVLLGRGTGRENRPGVRNAVGRQQGGESHQQTG